LVLDLYQSEIKELESMAGYLNLSQIKSATQNFNLHLKIKLGKVVLAPYIRWN